MNIAILNFERIQTRTARDNYIDLRSFGAEHISREYVTLDTIQRLDFFFVSNEREFKILKNRSPALPEQGTVLPLSYLPKTMELIMEYYQPMELAGND